MYYRQHYFEVTDTVIRIHIVVKQNIEKINNHVAFWIEKVTCETTDIFLAYSVIKHCQE